MQGISSILKSQRRIPSTHSGETVHRLWPPATLVYAFAGTLTLSSARFLLNLTSESQSQPSAANCKQIQAAQFRNLLSNARLLPVKQALVIGLL